MKCPNCGHDLEEGMKFCTSCGTNIEDALKLMQEKEAQMKKEEEERKAIEEEKKRLDEEKLRLIREEEERKREQEEKEKQEKAAEENAKKAIENIVEEKASKEVKAEEKQEIPKEEKNEAPKNVESANNFKPAKNQTIERPKKRRKGFLRRVFDRLVLIIVLLAILIGGVYYLNANGYLPEQISSQINGLIDQIKDIKSKLDKDYEKEDIDKDEEENKTEDPEAKEDERWLVENKVEADDIVTLNEEVSAIIVDGKYGIIDNKTGEILLDTKYEKIYLDMGSNITVILDNGVLSTVDSKYQPTGKASGILYSTVIAPNEYIYNTEDRTAYVLDNEGTLKEIEKDSERSAVVCREVTIKDDDIEEKSGEKTVSRDKIQFSDLYGVYSIEKGEMILDCLYSQITEFNKDGLAAAKKDDKAGFIDEEGNEIEFNLEETRDVHSGSAWAKLDGKWGIIKVEK